MRFLYKTFAVAALTLGSAVALPAAAQDFTHTPSEVRSGFYVLDPAHGKITWSISHLGYSTYIGQFSDVQGRLALSSGNPEQSKLDVTINMDSAGTLHPDLDAHLKHADFFHTEKFPTASFKSTSVRAVEGNKAEITGDLTLRGVTRSVVVHAVFNQAGVNPLDKIYTVGFDGAAVIKRSDFGIEYGLPLLGDEVKLQIEGEFKYASEVDKVE